MKQIILLLVALCLCGCSAPTYETIADEPAAQVSAPTGQIFVNVPQDATVLAGSQEDGGTVYECGGYTMSLQTLPAGDLDETLFTLTGYHKDELQLMEWSKAGNKRYDCVFTAAGEDGLQVGRACVLDDGKYHYSVMTLAPEETAGDLTQQWKDIYTSFQIVDSGWDINTGS